VRTGEFAGRHGKLLVLDTAAAHDVIVPAPDRSQ
jgi:hypothetical protein